MGNSADFFSHDAKGHRSEYVAITSPKIVNGVKGSIIKKVGDSDTHTNLPYYSNTSDVYFRKNANGVCQARVLYMLDRKSVWTLTGVTIIVIPQMAECSPKVEFMFKYGKRTKMTHC